MRIGNDAIQFDSTSLAADAVSEPIWLGHIAYYSMQLVWTGDPDGTFTLEMSNDAGRPEANKEDERDFGIVNWTQIGGSASVVTAAGDLGYNVENAGYRWVRVKFTASTAGANTPLLTSSRFNVKGV